MDCIDDAFEKCPLIAACVARDVAVVVVGAAGGLADPTQVCAADLVRATNDDLLAHTRKLLRRQRGYPSTERPWAAEHWCGSRVECGAGEIPIRAFSSG